MKVVILIVGLALSASIASTILTPQVGRFQLVRGTMPVWEGEGSEAFFRIDTKTGETWSLDAYPVNLRNGQVGQTQAWTEVREETDPSFQQLMSSMIVAE